MARITNFNSLKQLAEEAAMQPQEMAAPLKEKNNKLFIGIPKEITYQENRTPLTPSAIQFLTNNGHEIVIEEGTGVASNFPDIQYAEAGARIGTSKEEIYKADIILKIAPPTENEVELMHANQILISALQVKSVDPVILKKMMQKRIIALAYEFLEDEAGSYPIVRAMSEIAGHASVLIGAEYLGSSHIGKGKLLGGFTGIPPTQVVVIGAGSVGEYATRAAIGLGATVKVFDNELYRLRRLQENVGQKVYTATLHPKILKEALRTCDIAIGALRGKKGLAPVIIPESMVENMKPLSVIIDIAIDHGGVFETSEITTHERPIFRKHNVIHYCVPNITSRVSRTASYALSNIFTPLLMEISEYGRFDDYLKLMVGTRRGVYIYYGQLTSPILAEMFGMKYKELDLLL
ncbi:MAG: alanine dehydrogenase [Bacteroidetes bacterium]|nr:alanine dehydrogenase [Bacteroidota bacterium]